MPDVSVKMPLKKPAVALKSIQFRGTFLPRPFGDFGQCISGVQQKEPVKLRQDYVELQVVEDCPDPFAGVGHVRA